MLCRVEEVIVLGDGATAFQFSGQDSR